MTTILCTHPEGQNVQKAGLVGWSSTWTKSLADTSVFFKRSWPGVQNICFFSEETYGPRGSLLSLFDLVDLLALSVQILEVWRK